MGERKKQRTNYFKQRVDSIISGYEIMGHNLRRLEKMLFIFEFTGVWTYRHPQIKV